MDKNASIGLILISIILLTYFIFFAPSPSTQPQNVEQKKNQSIETFLNADVVQAIHDTALAGFKYGKKTDEEILTLENNELKIEISSIGAQLKKVLLKNHKDYKGNILCLLDENSFNQTIKLILSKTELDISKIKFSPKQNKKDKLTLLALNNKNEKIEIQYELPENNFLLHVKINLDSTLITSDSKLTFDFYDKVIQTEKDMHNNKISTTVSYYTVDRKYTSLSETSSEPQKESVHAVQWIAFKRKFFLVGILSGYKNFKNVTVSTSPIEEGSQYVKNLLASFEIATTEIEQRKAGFTYYLGPNHYNTVKKVAEGFSENVYLGWPIVNVFNKYVIIPIFNFLETLTDNYGLIIFLLVLIVKASLFPLSYRAYLSMAKIKVLKPELDEIKARVGDDMAALQQEQMKLYQSVGVNPLSGCIPILLQMPILLAMFNFFPNAFELRHKPFLWADDLSTYDSILDLPFSIPFGYGDHVSLFTLLMTASTLLYTWYNIQMSTATLQGPMLYIQYLMPIIFMFVLNSMSSGLTYYYFISNLITILQQYIMKQFVDEKEVRAKLEAYKATAHMRKKNRFQIRMEEALKAQEEARKKRQAAKKK
jgi:YidC/Oxa1 family membrane protein insertase